jgi:hypothetical protein
MARRRLHRIAALLPRLPLLALGASILASSLNGSCGGEQEPSVAGDAASQDSPSDDSPANRADGMSYGDAYGQ